MAASLPLSRARDAWRRLPSAALLIQAAIVLIVVALLLATAPLAALAALAGLALVVAILRWPALGLYLLAVSVPLQSLRTAKVASLNFSSTEVLVILTSVAWISSVLVRRERVLSRAPLLVPLLAFLAAIFLSFLQAQDLTSSLKELIKWLELLAVYVLAANVLRGRDQLRVLVVALVGMACVEAAYGLVQFVTRHGPPSFLIHGRFLRAFGTFDQPNPFAGYLNLTLPLVLALFLSARGGYAILGWRGWLGRREPLLWGAAAALLLAAVGASLSRGAWIALAAAAVVLATWANRAPRRYVGWGSFAAIVVAWIGAVGLLPGRIITAILQAFSVANVDTDIHRLTPETFSAAQRLAYWIAGWRMFSDHAWLGVGMGNYGINYQRYAVAGWETQLAHAHDYYLNLAAETGLVGLAAFLALVAAAGYQTWVAAFRSPEPFARVLSMGALGMLVTLCVHNLFDDLFVHGTVNVIALLLGASAATAQGPPAPAMTVRQPPDHPGPTPLR